jgi:hypothetical protein
MSEELSEGVQLLLQRMESHPDEFDLDRGKWASELNVVYARVSGKTPPQRAEPWLSTAEVEALWNKYVEIKQRDFHGHVMKKLFDDEEERPLDAYGLSLGKQRLQGTVKPGTWVNVANQTSSTPITLQGNTTVQGTFDAEPSPSFVQKIKKELGL